MLMDVFSSLEEEITDGICAKIPFIWATHYLELYITTESEAFTSRDIPEGGISSTLI